MNSNAANLNTIPRSRYERFERLISGVTEDLNHFANWLNNDPEQAKEVVQETMLLAWRCFDSLRDEAAVKSWLFTIARNENYRLHTRKKFSTLSIDEPLAEQNGGHPQLSTRDDDSDLEAIYEALNRMDSAYREPLLLKALKGHSSREIGSMMGLTIGAVNTRVFRGRDQLRSILDEMNRPHGSRCRVATSQII